MTDITAGQALACLAGRCVYVLRPTNFFEFAAQIATTYRLSPVQKRQNLDAPGLLVLSALALIMGTVSAESLAGQIQAGQMAGFVICISAIKV